MRGGLCRQNATWQREDIGRDIYLVVDINDGGPVPCEEYIEAAPFTMAEDVSVTIKVYLVF